MKYESIGNNVALNQAIPSAAPARATAEPLALGDLWRRTRIWWLRTLRLRLRQPRRLRLCESLPLGERCFVAVVEFERSRFLVGGTSASLVLLARLGRVQDQGDDGPADRPAGVSQESHD